ncbi:MAG: hypothetical protein ACI88H_000715 [Cocleimonas sp.]
MLNEIALFCGMFGTAWLALDLAQPKILEDLSLAFKRLTEHNFNPIFLFKDVLSESDDKALLVVRSVGFYSSILIFCVIQYFYQPSEETLRYYSYIPLSIFGSMLLGYFLMSVNQTVAGLLISVPSYIMLPITYMFFLIFTVISWCLQMLIKQFVAMENKWIGEHQAPRFLGLILLFISFLLQFIALKS